MSAGLQSSEGMTGVVGSTSKMVPSHGWQVGATWWQEGTVPLYINLPIMAAWGS